MELRCCTAEGLLSLCDWSAVMVGQHVIGHMKSHKLSNRFGRDLCELKIQLAV